jgi:hypothetical protein
VQTTRTLHLELSIGKEGEVLDDFGTRNRLRFPLHEASINRVRLKGRPLAPTHQKSRHAAFISPTKDL